LHSTDGLDIGLYIAGTNNAQGLLTAYNFPQLHVTVLVEQHGPSL